MKKTLFAVFVYASAVPMLAQAATYDIDPQASFVEVETISDLRWTVTEAPEWVDMGWTYSTTSSRYALSGSLNLEYLGLNNSAGHPEVRFGDAAMFHQAPLNFDFAVNVRREFDASTGVFGRAIDDPRPPFEAGCPPLWAGGIYACFVTGPAMPLWTPERLSGRLETTEVALTLEPNYHALYNTTPIITYRVFRPIVSEVGQEPGAPPVYGPVILPDPGPVPILREWPTGSRISQVSIVGTVSSVPEPSEAILLLVGLGAGLAQVGRRRSNF
nr:PEP-CTERM sorting domain-containing protein [uncultured Roseateles sp.]